MKRTGLGLAALAAGGALLWAMVQKPLILIKLSRVYSLMLTLALARPRAFWDNRILAAHGIFAALKS